MVTVASLLLWLLVGAVSVRALAPLLVADRSPASRVWRIGRFIVAVLLLGALYLRPHEAVLSGQDEAAYMNAALRFDREQALVFEDAMLGSVPTPVRPDFLFGHRYYGLTKYNCLWVRDLDRALLEPRFQPAFSVLLASWGRVGGVYGTLLATPVLGLLAVGMAAALVGAIWRDRRVAWFSALLLGVTPLWVWHTRFARPEVVAALLLMGGLALLLGAMRQPSACSRLDVVLGALALAWAPMFHVIAWFAVIPCGLGVAIYILSGRSGLGPVLPVLGGGAVLYVVQTLALTDPYDLSHVLHLVVGRGWRMLLWVSVLLLFPLALSLALRGVWQRFLRLRARVPVLYRAGRWIRWFTVGAVLAVVMVVYRWHPPIAEREFQGLQYYYAYPTDLRVAMRLLSWPVMLAAVLGTLFTLGLGKSRAGIFAVLCLLPGMLFVGNLYDFFLSRYLLSVALPLVVCGVAGVLVAAGQLRRAGRGLQLLLLAGLITGGLWGRTQLLTMTQHRGFVGGFRRIAERVKAEDGLLLGEYSRVVATLDHGFGVSALALDNGSRHDYRAALAAWKKLMQREASRPAFFLTPYSAPRVEGLVMEPVATYAMPYERLRGQRFGVPRDVKSGQLDLTLYRMTLGHAPLNSEPFVRRLDESNMGLDGFARGRWKTWEVDVHALHASVPCELALPDGLMRALLVVAVDAPGETPPVLNVSTPGAACRVLPGQRIGDEWWCVEVRGRANMPLPRGLALASQQPAWLGGVIVEDGAAVEVRGPSPEKRVLQAPWHGRWARARCGVSMGYPSRGAWLVVLASAPHDAAAMPRLNVYRADAPQGSIPLVSESWRWVGCRLGRVRGRAQQRRIRFAIEPPWDPGKARYPVDLGARVACVATVPLASRPDS